MRYLHEAVAAVQCSTVSVVYVRCRRAQQEAQSRRLTTVTALNVILSTVCEYRAARLLTCVHLYLDLLVSS
jgi:type III secretory pathway lipoprotein EscJ